MLWDFMHFAMLLVDLLQLGSPDTCFKFLLRSYFMKILIVTTRFWIFFSTPHGDIIQFWKDTSEFDLTHDKRSINIWYLWLHLGNHPLLIRRLYFDETVKKLAKKYHPLRVFGDECDLQRVEDELSSYSDFALHKVISHYPHCPLLICFQVLLYAAYSIV